MARVLKNLVRQYQYIEHFPNAQLMVDLLKDLEQLRAKALAMGGPDKLAKRRAAGILNARERLDYLFDKGTFIESGLFGTSVYPEARDKSPGDGKIAGYGKISGREAACVANDFTVMGASSAATNMKKIGQMKRAAVSRGMPLVFLGESSGARLPDIMGARGMGSLLAQDPQQYLRLRESPWVSAALGLCYGSSTWYCVLADLNVMRKGAIVAVSSSLLASLAMNDPVDAEELGGWRVHAEITGFADMVVDTDEEALDAIKDGKPRLLDFGVTDEQAWDVGLACGGKVQVFVEKVT